MPLDALPELMVWGSVVRTELFRRSLHTSHVSPVPGPEGPSIFNEGASPFAQRIVQESSAPNGLGGSSALNGEAEFGPIGAIHSNQGAPSRVLNRDPFGRPTQEDLQQGAGLGGSFSNHSSPFIPHAQAAFPQTPLSQFGGQDNRSLHSMTPERPQIPFIQQLQQPFVQTPGFTNNQSPWHTQEAPAFRRPGPFDANHPTSANTFVAQPVAPSQPLRIPQGAVQTDQSPWHTPIQPVQNDPWGAQTASLTAANLGQHDEQQRQAELRQQIAKPVPQPVTVAEPEPVPVRAEEPLPQPSVPVAAEPMSITIPSPVDVAPQKPRRKSTAQPAPAAPLAPRAAPSPPAPAPVTIVPAKAPSPSQTEPKAVWAVEEDKKKGAAPTLREIQEAEAKKVEARKAEQRERERAERVARTSSQSEEFQSFTTSWGLPTSQAGTRSNSNGPKEVPVTALPFSAPAPVAPAPAVWTNAAKTPVAKKTMKEIQEEEERKRKLAKEKEKESMAAAARRGYADTTTKVSVTCRTIRLVTDTDRATALWSYAAHWWSMDDRRLQWQDFGDYNRCCCGRGRGSPCCYSHRVCEGSPNGICHCGFLREHLSPFNCCRRRSSCGRCRQIFIVEGREPGGPRTFARVHEVVGRLLEGLEQLGQS